MVAYFRAKKRLLLAAQKKGDWLQIESGWVNAKNFEADADVMTLPVGGGETAATVSSTSTVRATPTSAPKLGLDARKIRTLVSRYTEDVRILDIKISNSATTIEYDLKPWPLRTQRVNCQRGRIQSHLRDSQWTADPQYAKIHGAEPLQE